MRVVGFVLLFGVMGYLVGATLGYLGIEKFSGNTHDRSLEASMTAAVVAGPAVALLGAIIGGLLALRSRGTP